MRLAKYRLSKAVLATVATSSASIGIMQSQASAATQQYFDVNGTTAGYGITNGATYGWDNAYWTSTSGGAAATSNWDNDGSGFARFYGGTSGNSYTVTVGQVEKNVGLFLNQSGVTLTINQAPSTSGALEIQTTFQGFLVIGTALIINAPITGSGGIVEQQSGGLYLDGSNSYTAGTATTGGQSLYYSNNYSFGTGTINFADTSTSGNDGQGVVNVGPAGVTIPNNINFGIAPVISGLTFPTTKTTTNFASGHGANGAPGAIFTGSVFLPAGLTTLEAGQATDVTEFTGNFTPTDSTSSITIKNPGTIIFTGSNSYQGGTTLTAGELVISSDNNVGGANTELDLNGGILGIAGNTLHDYGNHQTLTGMIGGGIDVQSATNTYTYEPTFGGVSPQKLGAGTLILNGQATYTGNLLDKAGALVLQGDSADSEVFSGGGVDIHGKLVLDYTTMGGTDTSAEVLASLTSGYHEATPFSSTSDPLFTSSNTNTKEGLGWKDTGTEVIVMKTFYGDANLDGTVNALDFNAFATNYGKNAGSEVWDQGDFNYDGSVDSQDFAILAANYGQFLTGASSAGLPDSGMVAQGLGSVVPEPGSLTLLALGGAALWTKRRRR